LLSDGVGYKLFCDLNFRRNKTYHERCSFYNTIHFINMIEITEQEIVHLFH